MNVQPRGSRILVKVLPTGPSVTPGGIHLPAPKSAVKGDEPGPDMPSLQICEVLEVGEGRYNPMDGRYRGSQYYQGQIVLARCGPSSILHWDNLPDDPEKWLILEDVIVGVLDRDLAPVLSGS